MEPVVLFDGVCNLCHASVRWILRRDARRVFRFASLQSPAARRLLQGAAVPDSVVLVDAEGIHTRSEAVLRIARELGWPWRLAAAARVMPRAWRDAVYAGIARNRYRWFGRKEACPLPGPDTDGRFLDGGIS